MNYKLVFHILGMILRVEAVLMVPAMIIGFASGGGDGTAFLYSALAVAVNSTASTAPPRGL